MQETKSIFASRTFWANIVMVAGVLINHFWGMELDAETETMIVGICMGVINVALRFKTNTAIR